MTLQELKEKCKENNWDIDRIYKLGNKVISKSTRLFRVRKETSNCSRSHQYRSYVRRKCSTCKKENMVDIDIYKRKGFNNNLKSQFGYAKKNFCSKSCRINGISGKNHYLFKEGKIIDNKSSDYILILTLKHPYRSKSNYVPYHRWIMEKHLGRYLKPVVRYQSGKKKGKIKEHGELVHHIDMDKRNNNISNLMICNGIGHHQDVHATYNNICRSLMDDGIIGFNKETGEYYLVKKESKNAI